MLKRSALTFIATTLFVIGLPLCVQAQPFSTPPATTPAEAPPAQPLSPDEFKQLSKQYHEETQKALNQSYDDAIAKQPPITPSSLPPPDTQNATGDSAKQPAPSAAPPVAAPKRAPAPTAETKLPPAPTVTEEPAPAAAPDAYTGFSPNSAPTNPAPTNNTPAGDNSGGWNVKY
jgi:hypothetical protein